MKISSFAVAVLTIGLLIPRLAPAHGGEDHAAPAKAVAGAAPVSSRTSASTDDFEVVVVIPAGGTPLRVYLAETRTNEPVAGASLSLQLGEKAFAAIAGAATGVYDIEIASPPHGPVDATLSIDTKDDSDLLALESLPFAALPPERFHLGGLQKIGLGAGAMVLIVALLIGGVFLARRRPRVAAIFFAVLCLPAVSRAHGGEDHGGGKEPKGATQATSEDTAGGVRILKEAQFLLGIRTVPAAESKVVSRLRTLGKIVPRPRARADVEAQQAGRLLAAVEDGHLPSLGSFVSKGEVLAWIQVVDRLPVRAPIAGVVTAVGHGTGESVEAGEKLLTITDLSTVWVESWVYEEDVGQVELANDAEVTAGAYPDKIFGAKRIGLSSEVEAESRAVIARLEVRNPEGKLRVGMLVDVNFLLPREQNVIVVPSSAVVERAGRPVVYVHRSAEVFEPRAVKLGTDEGGKVSILDGLKPGDRVVVDGAYDILAAQNAAGG